MMVTKRLRHHLPLPAPRTCGRGLRRLFLRQFPGDYGGRPPRRIHHEFPSWKWIFLINVPIGIGALYLVGKALPAETATMEKNSNSHPFELDGSIFCVIALSAFVYVLSTGDEAGWTSTASLTGFTVSLAAFLAFIVCESKHPTRSSILPSSGPGFRLRQSDDDLRPHAPVGMEILLPFYLEIVKGLKTDQVGLIILVYSAVYMPIGLFSGRLSDRIHPPGSCTAATIVAADRLCRLCRHPLIAGPAAPHYISGTAGRRLRLLFCRQQPSRHVPGPGRTSGQRLRPVQHGHETSAWSLGVCLFESAFSQGLPHGIPVRRRQGRLRACSWPILPTPSDSPS